MSALIVDPEDENHAILADGTLGTAFRLGKITDPSRPTRAEIEAMPIIGYGNFSTKKNGDTQ